MPSENKTANIGLNQWQANEYPKREDFNADNLAIDETLDGKLSKTGDGKDVTVNFTEATTRTNIGTGEKLSVLFGKIKKWFSDLTDLAFGKCGSATNQALYTMEGGVVTADKLPIEAGGTGARTAAGVRTNLNISDATVPISDDVATALGLDPADNPQVKDGFDKLGEIYKYWWKRVLIKNVPIIGYLYEEKLISSKENPGGITKVYYSNNIKVVNDNILLDNPIVLNVTYNTADNTNVLAGKYFSFSPEGLVFYGRVGGSARRSSGSYNKVYFYATDVNLALRPDFSQLEYLSDSDPNKYPENVELQGYYYMKLGQPFLNARMGNKVEIGSYIGTGTYGGDNLNSLAFGFEPKLLIIRHASGIADDYGIFTAVKGCKSVRTSFTDSAFDYGCSIVRWDVQIKWYSNHSPSYQMNYNNHTYVYIAIG